MQKLCSCCLGHRSCYFWQVKFSAYQFLVTIPHDFCFLTVWYRVVSVMQFTVLNSECRENNCFVFYSMWFVWYIALSVQRVTEKYHIIISN